MGIVKILDFCFNTQPPEGGWADEGGAVGVAGFEFQHTAARRRLVALSSGSVTEVWVSTHSRPKAAGYGKPGRRGYHNKVSTHSRPKAAGRPVKQSPS